MASSICSRCSSRSIVEVLLDERLDRDHEFLTVNRCRLGLRLTKRLGAELVDQPRLPADGLLQILQPLIQRLDGLCVGLQPLRNLSAIVSARGKNKHQKDNARQDIADF
jgi:hypothetical protein